MFIGHYAVALAAKRATPTTSLGTLFLASQFVDLLWPVFLLLDIEHVRIEPGNTAMTPLDFYDYPFTHSLFGALMWSLLFGLLYYVFRRNRRGALVLSICVISHWILDLITHRPDLPLVPGSELYFGLGLWNSVIGSVAVELLLFAAGVTLYVKTTVVRGKTGVVMFWSLIILLMIIWIANLVGPPPPDVSMIAYAGNLMWLFVVWAYVADRHRSAATYRNVMNSNADV